VRTIIHRLSGATHDRRPDGRVEVMSRDGELGVFDAHGTWISGPSARPIRTCACGSAAASSPRAPATPPDTTARSPRRRRRDDDDPTGPRVARSPGISYQELLDTDSRPENVPVVLRWQRNEHLGSADIPRARYVSREFHDVEKEKVWKKAWQMACREEDIPDVGDTLVYDICDLSLLVVRVDATTIKAYYNACLHRGRQLKECAGNNTELRCAFHGYCWNLDGSLEQIPCEWDCPQVEPAEWAPPEVGVGTWGGFVFVNLDPDGESLAWFLGELPEHFAKWPLEERYKAAHVAKVFPANWKVVQEAFMEAFHVVATHAELLAGIGDATASTTATATSLGPSRPTGPRARTSASSRRSSRCSTP
jgi:nitrite reductase/ring-hydroxylating ferredoxin subunit